MNKTVGLGCLVLLASCGQSKEDKRPVAQDGQATTAAAVTADDAAAYIATVEKEMEAFLEYGRRVSWIQSTHITDDTNWLMSRVEGEYADNTVRWAEGAKRFNELDLPADARRKLTRLKQEIHLPAPSGDKGAAELGEVKTRLRSTYAKAKADIGGEKLDVRAIANKMRSESEPDKLAALWNGWRRIAVPMKADFARMVEIGNRGARELGFTDMRQLWLSQYDMPAEAMVAEVDRLWGQVKPLYEQLHCHVRAKLGEQYGDKVVEPGKPIPAHLLRDVWAQQWTGVADVVRPKSSGKRPYDLTAELEKRKYTPRKMFETGERFFTSLGFDKLPETFWERSMIEKPDGREVACHPSAYDVDTRSDVRIRMCTSVSAQDFNTVHHELGHLYYELAYNDKSPIYRASANDGFSEAVGDFLALSVTPSYLRELELIGANQATGDDLGFQMDQALDRLAFLPFAVLVDKWRWQVFSGEVAPKDYDEAWWKLRHAYQGVRRPSPAQADAFDPGAKYHIPNNTPYLRYFLAFVLQFQFHKAACDAAGWKGPLHQCSIYGNKTVGTKLAAMMAAGASQPWPETLEAFTGSKAIDAGAVVAYFAPLMKYLSEQNSGRTCGW